MEPVAVKVRCDSPRPARCLAYIKAIIAAPENVDTRPGTNAPRKPPLEILLLGVPVPSFRFFDVPAISGLDTASELLSREPGRKCSRGNGLKLGDCMLYGIPRKPWGPSGGRAP